MIGRAIGHYQIVGKLGEGGMGEVYRARDTKLDRDVALKILPETFAGDPERRARFTREAKTLAALNHTHIAQIYGVEDSGATSALVMELVDGEDLSERIRRGPLSYADAMAIAKQIAQALEAAHEQGIIHRDLKPANIKLRDDGTIKILDFGLAKALDPASAGNSQRHELANSPTITSPAGVTLGGVILGTAAYMSPEQAKGRGVDKRADIWAFGCVLYEMLTGRRTFAGDDVSDTLAAVLRSDVDLSRVPPSVRRLLAKCLEKDPKRRLHDIGDAWDLIDDGPRLSSDSARMLWLGWGLAAVFLAAAVAVAMLHFTEAPARPMSARFQIAPPPNASFEIYLALSPDGRRLAFTAAEAGGALQLWVRDLESLEARRLPGTEGAASPFWSPDGRYLGFAEGPRIKKIDIEGGLPQVIAESSAGNAGVGAWSKDGVIVFGSRTPNVGIRRVPATGGTPVEVTNVDMSAGENIHSFPFFLSDARHFLYYVASSRPEVQGIYIGSVDGPLKERPSRLVEASLGPVMTAADGPDTKLFFVRDGTLMAQSFNADTALLSGTPIPVAERIGNVGSFAFFSVVSNVLPTALVRQRRPICRSFPGWAARAIYSATSENRDDFRPPPFRCRLRRTAARRRSWLRAPRLPVLTSGRSSSRAGSRRA